MEQLNLKISDSTLRHYLSAKKCNLGDPEQSGGVKLQGFYKMLCIVNTQAWFKTKSYERV